MRKVHEPGLKLGTPVAQQFWHAAHEAIHSYSTNSKLTLKKSPPPPT